MPFLPSLTYRRALQGIKAGVFSQIRQISSPFRFFLNCVLLITPYSILKGHFMFSHLNDPKQFEYLIGPYFFHCVIELFFHFLPSVLSAAALSLLLEILGML